MSEDTSRVVKTAAVAVALALIVMGVNIWMGYNVFSESTVDSYTVEAIGMAICTFVRDGSTVTGQPNFLGIFVVCVIYAAVLVMINETLGAGSSSSKNTKSKKKNKKKKK